METNSRGIVRERAKQLPMMVTIVSFNFIILLLMTVILGMDYNESGDSNFFPLFILLISIVA